jgi:hypothetical protein
MMRNITLNELEGFKEALLELCISVDLSAYNTIDLCGTGGDNKDTFNISTLSAFVTAGAGVKVAKHGNYGVSSSCGSSNVMENLGIKFSNDRGYLEKCIEKSGICILHAPLFHPAMKHVAPIRKELGLKTFFNMLGPLVNPSFPKNQIVGVFSLELEWTLDQYDSKSYYRYLGQNVSNPYEKPTKLYPRVVKGGSWMNSSYRLRSASRQGSSKRWKKQDPQIPRSIWWHTDAQFVGFRIIRPKNTPQIKEQNEYWNN